MYITIVRLEEIMDNRLNKKTLQLEGMSCSGCETIIENRLKKLNGVREVNVNYQSGKLEITYDATEISLEKIIKIIEKMDYTVKKDMVKSESTVEKNSNNQLIILGIILFGIYMIIKNTIGFNFIPEVSSNMGYTILFVVGLLSSLHCIAMCGGINLSLCVSYRSIETDTNTFAKLRPSFLYNAGRVISYTIIGGFVGALGSVFRLSNIGSAFISIMAGVFMVIMGLNMLNVFPWLRKFNPHMPKVFAKKIHSEKKNKGPFVVGLLTGLMPCGPLQAMQLYALGTGSFITGAISMFIFSLGTVPLLFAFGALGSLLSSKFTKQMIKVSAVLVMVLGVAMMNRGIAFTGKSFGSVLASTKTDSVSTNTSTLKEDVQEIQTTLESGSYPAISVQEGIPVKWTIMADDKNLNGCNNEIIIPEYNIEQKLVAGENVISFTPDKSGKFGYSCWMGMIRSSITVTSNATDSANEQQPKVLYEPDDSTQVDNTGLPAGCCGGF